MTSVRASSAVLAVIAACAPVREVSLPRLDVRTQALLVAVERPGAAPLLFARSRDDAPQAIAVGPDATLTLLELSDTLATLGLEAGALALATGDRSRPLPPYFAAHALAGDGAWRPVTELGPIGALRLAAIDPFACAEGGGCVAAGRCTLPCPRPAEPAAPAPPELPRWTPCPAGWEARAFPEDARGAGYCEPFPAATPATCPMGQYVFPGEAECRALGPCSAGTFSDAVVGRVDVLFVDAEAAAGGDGSIERPWTSLEVARAAAPPGATIALARGTYAGAGTVSDVDVVGACAATTIIDAGEGPLTLDGHTRLRGVTVRARGAALRATGDAAVELEDVVVEAVREAIEAVGARVVLREVALSGAMGLAARDGAVVSGARVSLAGPGVGIEATGGARVALTDVAVSGCDMAVHTRGAHVELASVVIEDAGVFGVQVREASTATLTDFVVRRTRSTSLGVHGVLVEGSTLTAARGLVEEIGGRAIYAYGGGYLALDDVTTRCTGLREPGSIAHHYPGLELSPRGRATVRRLASIGDDGVAIAVREGSWMVASDVVITRQCRGARSSTPAIVVGGVARAEVTRAIIEPGAIEAIRLGPEAAEARFVDLAIGPTFGDAIRSAAGWSLSAQDPIELELERVSIREPGQAALSMHGLGRVTATDLSITGPTEGARTGVGIDARLHDELVITRFAVERLAIALRIEDGAGLTLHDGLVRDNALAIQVEPGAEPASLFDGVLYEANAALRGE
ncbi:hypothetical protein L6R52_24690 [Myxococcota bacterium]|nr:hypothetical protein [Myxococcota bacterium]